MRRCPRCEHPAHDRRCGFPISQEPWFGGDMEIVGTCHCDAMELIHITIAGETLCRGRGCPHCAEMDDHAQQIVYILGRASEGTVDADRAFGIALRALAEACDNREGK